MTIANWNIYRLIVKNLKYIFAQETQHLKPYSNCKNSLNHPNNCENTFLGKFLHKNYGLIFRIFNRSLVSVVITEKLIRIHRVELGSIFSFFINISEIVRRK